MSVFLILASFVYLTIAQQSIAPALDGFRKLMALSPGQIEFLKTGTSVCFALGMLAGGFIQENKKRPLIIGTTLIILSALLTACGSCRSFDILVMLRFAIGICSGLLTTTLVILGIDLLPQKFWHTWIALKSFALMAGGAVAFVVGGLVISKTGGQWQLVFKFLGPPGFILALMTFLIKTPVRRIGSPLSLKASSLTEYFKSRVFLIFMGSAALAALCIAFLNHGLSEVYFTKPPVKSAGPSTAVMASMLVLVAATIVSAVVSEAVVRKNATGGYNIVATCLAACILCPIFWLALFNEMFIYLFSFFEIFSLIPLTVLVVSLARSSHRALIFGLCMGTFQLLGLAPGMFPAPVLTNNLVLSGITILMSLSVAGIYIAGNMHRRSLQGR